MELGILSIIISIISLSVPVFYLLGLAEFIKAIIKTTTNGVKQERLRFLRQAVSDLIKSITQNPNKLVQEQINDYNLEISQLATQANKIPYQPFPAAVPIPAALAVEPKNELKKDLNNFWSNWYSENSINLLLYLGAFLIIASASIFVGFQWETMSGITKAYLINLVTLSFFGSGLWFCTKPKIRNAGMTFTAIGALLIPFCGLAWYNFYLKASGVSFGSVWSITSLVSIITYIFLANRFASRFYTYSASAASLSLALSFVNLYGLNHDFYIVSGILSAFILLVIAQLMPITNEDTKRNFRQPLELSANTIMPFFLIYGFALATTENKLFTLEATLSTILGALYYLYAYLFSRKTVYLILSQILFPIGFMLFHRWQGWEISSLFSCLNLISLLYCILGWFFNKKNLPKESESNYILAITISIVSFLLSYSSDISSTSKLIYAFSPALIGILITSFKRTAQTGYLGTSTIFIGISCFVLFHDLLPFEDKRYLLGLSYLTLGIGYYLLSYILRTRKEFFSIFAFSSGLFFFLSLICNMDRSGYLLISTATISGISVLASLQFGKTQFIYLSNIMLYFSLFNYLRFCLFSKEYFPLAFSLLSYLLYALSRTFTGEVRDKYYQSALAGLIATPLISAYCVWTLKAFNFSRLKEDFLALERNSLITAYLATALVTVDALLKRKASFSIFASSVGVATYLWQINYLGITEVQYYTLPLGLYFLALAYYQRIKGKWEKRDILDWIGLFLIIIPTLFQSFGINGSRYALLLGIEGIGLVALGNSLIYKTYIYAGIFSLAIAIISQTYEYVFSLPRWIITGVGGLLFLALAIYLLLSRKEK